MAILMGEPNIFSNIFDVFSEMNDFIKAVFKKKGARPPPPPRGKIPAKNRKNSKEIRFRLPAFILGRIRPDVHFLNPESPLVVSIV